MTISPRPLKGGEGQGEGVSMLIRIILLITCLLVFSAGVPYSQATETGEAQQMQQLQEEQPVDGRFADYFNKLQQSPKDPALHIALAEVYLERNLLEMALTSFRRALIFDPTSARAHFGLSRLYRKKELKKVELEEMQVAVQLAPDNNEYRYELGVLYMEPANFDYKKAKDQYKALKNNASPLAEKLAALMQLDS
jgi:cytochrome c-type biogenesis protein CcmH/NrfG